MMKIGFVLRLGKDSELALKDKDIAKEVRKRSICN